MILGSGYAKSSAGCKRHKWTRLPEGDPGEQNGVLGTGHRLSGRGVPVEESGPLKSSSRGSYIRVFAAAGVAVLLAGFVIIRGASAPQKPPRPYTTWSAWGGTKDSMQYSALTQINKTNVSQLEQVWFYRWCPPPTAPFAPPIK
jgi:hypothetical protein